jgi:hypothetical protein
MQIIWLLVLMGLLSCNVCGAQPQPAPAQTFPAQPTRQADRSETDSRSPGSGERVVPDVTSCQTVADVKTALTKADLIPVLVSAPEPPPDKAKEFRPASQNPASGTRVRKGSSVEVAIYPAFEANAGSTVPDLTGMTLPEALAALKTCKLSLGSMEFAESGKCEDEGRIARQDPQAGAPVPASKSVKVTRFRFKASPANPTPSPTPSATTISTFVASSAATPALAAPSNAATPVQAAQASEEVKPPPDWPELYASYDRAKGGARGFLGRWEGVLRWDKDARTHNVEFVDFGGRVVPNVKWPMYRMNIDGNKAWTEYRQSETPTANVPQAESWIIRSEYELAGPGVVKCTYTEVSARNGTVYRTATFRGQLKPGK